jgi:hypothetical protein
MQKQNAPGQAQGVFEARGVISGREFECKFLRTREAKLC